jgi:hypothetical protein
MAPIFRRFSYNLALQASKPVFKIFQIICTIVSLNGTLAEAKIRTSSVYFSFNKCPI